MDFDKDRYKIITWKNGMVLHWILNPGLAINELILGQRVPKIYIEDRLSDKSFFERTFIPCPHCNMLHDYRTWSLQNKTVFKNWFGLYCYKCGQVIPCTMNLFTFLILIITYPLRFWYWDSLKDKWLAAQPKRFQNLDLLTIPKQGKRQWIKTGLIWGLFMFITMTFIFPYFQDDEITMTSIYIGVPIWTLGGLGFGYTMHFYTKKKILKSKVSI